MTTPEEQTPTIVENEKPDFTVEALKVRIDGLIADLQDASIRENELLELLGDIAATVGAEGCPAEDVPGHVARVIEAARSSLSEDESKTQPPVEVFETPADFPSWEELKAQGCTNQAKLARAKKREG